MILLDDKSVLCQSLSFKKLFLKYILKRKLSSPKTWGCKIATIIYVSIVSLVKIKKEVIFLFIIMEWPYKMSLYLACRCRWTLQSGQDKWHHSGRAWTSIHWCQSHNVGRHIPGHIDTGKTPLCSHIFQNAHMGLHLLVEGKGLEYGTHSEEK